MLFTEKTFDKCLEKVLTGGLQAILFTGNNFGLSTILGDKLVEGFKPEEKILLDYQDDTKEKPFFLNLKSNLQNGFFSNKKIIKIFNIKSSKGVSKSFEFLENESFNDKLILIFGNEIDGKNELKTFFEKGQKIACVNLYEDDENLANSIVKNFFSEKNIFIENNAISLIGQKLHGDRKELLNECEKILLCYNDKKSITAQDVELTIENEQGSDLVLLVDNILSGNVKQSFLQLSFFEKEEGQLIVILRFFIKTINDLLDIKNNISNGVSIEEAIKYKFFFWKRIPYIKLAISKSTIKLLTNYIKIALQSEKMVKMYGENIAKNFFIKNILLFNVR